MFVRLEDILESRCGFCFTTALVFVRMKFEGERVKLCPNCLCVRVGALVEAKDGTGPRVACHVVYVKVGSRCVCIIVVAEVSVDILHF